MTQIESHQTMVSKQQTDLGNRLSLRINQVELNFQNQYTTFARTEQFDQLTMQVEEVSDGVENLKSQYSSVNKTV